MENGPESEPMKTQVPTLERVGARDRFADYCLWDYEPPAPPSGKLRSSNLLWRAIEAAGGDARLREACEALRDGLGPFRTVYGVKKFGDRLSFEFYFYDYARLGRAVSIPKVLAALAPFVDCKLRYSENRPYFMFSIDLDADVVNRRRPLDTINIYVGNPGSSVSSGICYELTREAFRLANFYFFFNAQAEMTDIQAKIACSAHHDLPSLPMDEILRPELRDCGVIVVSNKKFGDGVYFSRISVDQLLGFLRRENFPAAIVDFATLHRDDLDHMLYDVGIDYRIEGPEAVVTKSAFYGLL